MKTSHLLQSRFTSVLITLLMTLLISACSTDDSATTTENSAMVSLSWIAPSARDDNTPISLSEIAGYNVYYGSTPGQYTNNVNISDSTAEGYTFNALPLGTYFFAVTTYDTDGRESQYSAEVTKVL